MATVDKLTKARIALIQNQPFFGSLLLRMPLIEKEEVETAGVDGISLYYAPSYVEKLDPLQLQGLLGHEVMHVALKHHLRRGERDHEQWNIACDYAINPILVDSGFTLPEAALIDPAYAGLSAEQIYSKLPPKPPSGVEGRGDEGKSKDPGGCGAVLDYPVNDPKAKSLAEAEAEIQVAVAQAANAAKAAGNLPAHLAAAAESIKKGNVDWKDQLRKFCQAIAANDYSWRRPARRHIARGIILPSLRSEAMGEIVVAIDTSGSVSDPALDAFLNEVSSIAEDLKPQRLHIVWCDTAIQKTLEAGPHDLPLDLEKIRGGGTSFQPVIDWIEQEKIDPACLVYLTDLQCAMPTEPDYPVLWASVDLKEAAFGDVINVVV